MSTTATEVVTPLTLTPGEIRFYKEEGYLYIPRLLNDEAITTLREEVLDVMEVCGMSYERLRQAQSSKDKLFQSGQYLEGSTLDQFINSPHLQAVAAQLMEGPSTLYMPFTAVKSGGGGGTFHFHQDNQYTRFDGPGINLWCALSDMSPENGCLQVVPRSHLSGTIDSVENPDGDGHRTVAREPERFLPVRMRAGDCIAFSRLTLHGSGPNQTNEPRIAYAVQFHRDDVRATWDGETRLLKEHPRWQHRPVKELTRPQERSRDGH
jgi:2-oxoglutarate-dependent dioxygenase